MMLVNRVSTSDMTEEGVSGRRRRPRLRETQRSMVMHLVNHSWSDAWIAVGMETLLPPHEKPNLSFQFGLALWPCLHVKTTLSGSI